MNSLRIIFASAAVLTVAFAAENVKEEAAGGYGAPAPAAQQPAAAYPLPVPAFQQPLPTFQQPFPAFQQAIPGFQQQMPNFQQQFPYFMQQPQMNFLPQFLVDNYFCSLDVSYVTYGGRANAKVPLEQSCDKVDLRQRNSCKKCCQNTARLHGINQTEVTGFEVVINKKARCTCCAPIQQVPQQQAPPTLETAQVYGQDQKFQQAQFAAQPQFVAQAFPQPVQQTVQTFGQQQQFVQAFQQPQVVQGYGQPMAQAAPQPQVQVVQTSQQPQAAQGYGQPMAQAAPQPQIAQPVASSPY